MLTPRIIKKKYVLSLCTMIILCISIAFCHLSEYRMIEPVDFYTFNAKEPFIYRIFLPVLFSKFDFVLGSCSTKLNFPIGSCADLTALFVDALSLMISCVIVLHVFRKLPSGDIISFHRPELVVPLFLWMVIFTYLIVPNRSIYYPYDFTEL